MSSVRSDDVCRAALLRPQSAPAGRAAHSQSTSAWRPGETSLCRSNYNAIVQHKKVDVTEVMMRTAKMGQQAEMGPGALDGGAKLIPGEGGAR